MTHTVGYGPFQYETDNPRIYRIIRYRQDGYTRRTIRSGVTLGEAQEHCSRADTKGDGWFDGYDYIRGYKK